MFKKAYLIISFFLLFVIGCATTPNLKQLNSLQPGISKAELIERFGEPKGTNYVDGCYILSYLVYDHKDIGHRLYYFMFNKNNQLVG